MRLTTDVAIGSSRESETVEAGLAGNETVNARIINPCPMRVKKKCSAMSVVTSARDQTALAERNCGFMKPGRGHGGVLGDT